MADSLSGNEDTVTRLNTQLNKSMVLMENAVDTPSEEGRRRSKSIKINTTVQLHGVRNIPATVKSRKSILKKSDKLFGEAQINNVTERSSVRKIRERISSPVSDRSRPRTLQELVQREALDVVSTPSKFIDLDDISDNEEIWIIDIPRAIDPRELHGQSITLGDKSKIKIKNQRYCAVTQNARRNVTCVFNAGKEASQYKIANIKPIGSLTVRKKLSGVLRTDPISLNSSTMPLFPDNVKTRHPLFGIPYDKKLRKRLRRHNSFKRNTKKM